MRRHFAVSLGFFAALLLYAQTGCTPEPVQEDVRNLSASEAAALIESHAGDPDFVIIDVRTPGEFVAGHIANAVNIDVLATDFEENIAALDKSHTYLVYCGTAHRSPMAIEEMDEAGFTNLYHLENGLVDWQAAGLPVVQ